MARIAGTKNRLKPGENKSLRDALLPHVDEAVRVKVNGLRSSDERIAQDCACDILNRVYGKAPQSLELGTKDNNPLSVILKILDPNARPN